MKTLLIFFAFMLSINLADAQERVHKKNTPAAAKSKIVYSESKRKAAYNKRKNPKKTAFGGENHYTGSKGYYR